MLLASYLLQICNLEHVPLLFQSGFRKGYSTVNQLSFSYLYYTVCQALDTGKEVKQSSVILAKHLTVFGIMLA